MKMKLAENIRALRKERSLTQEQLAEVLRVTTGAVYKWEAGLSVPDIGLILEMADFFDTSVDALLGYQMKDNREEAMVKRLRECRRDKEWEGLAEAEKALKKYPHSFRIVRECALIHLVFGIESGDSALYARASQLLEQSRLLLSQNTDPEIGEQTIYGDMAAAYLGVGETEKAIELWKAHNAGGVFNHRIGHILAQQCNRADEAMPYLSQSLLNLVSALTETINGYLNVYGKNGDYADAEAILNWGIAAFTGLRKADRPNFLDRVSSIFLAGAAQMQFESGREDAARASLEKAKELAAFFDAAPSYDVNDIRFISRVEGASVHDGMGATAMDGIERVVGEFDHEAFTALWKSVAEQDPTDGEEPSAGAQPTV